MSRIDFDDTIVQLHNSRSCCADFSALSFEDLRPNSNLSTSIDASQPAYDFGVDGLSYVRAYRLSASSDAARLIVRSYIFSDGYPSKKALIFAPKILLLDKQFHEISRADSGNAIYLQSHFNDDPNKPAKLEESINISPSQEFRYVIIYTPKSSIGAHFDYAAEEQPTILGVGKALVPIGGGATDVSFVGAPVAPKGYLSVRLLTSNGNRS